MSTAGRTSAPPLVDGQRLDQREFHIRYEAMPPGIKAELIGGVVYMSSPVGLRHCEDSGLIVTWLNMYRFRTPGTQVGDNGSVILDDLGEVQPDAFLRILPAKGGRTSNVGKYVGGVPELIVEISDSSRSIDLGAKLAEYERAGALEYVVLTIDPDEVFWQTRQGDRLVRIEPGPDGLFRSTTFPGLWFDPAAFFAKDGLAMLAALDRGLATPEHAQFAAPLAAR